MPTQRPIRFGVFPGAVNATWPELREVWQCADEAGYVNGASVVIDGGMTAVM